MSTLFNDIMGALESHLSAINLQVDIVWPNNYPDQLEVGKEYLFASHLFGSTLQACLGDDGKDETVGIFQVDAVTPVNQGRSSHLDQVANRFKRGTVLQSNITKLRITSVSQAASFVENNHYRQPLSIAWQVYSTAR